MGASADESTIGVGQKENKTAHLRGAEEANHATLKQEWVARSIISYYAFLYLSCQQKYKQTNKKMQT